jgi:hypothetical protein
MSDKTNKNPNQAQKGKITPKSLNESAKKQIISQ